MKKLKLLTIGIAVCGLAMVSQAQTNLTQVPSGLPDVTNLVTDIGGKGKVAHDLALTGKDIWANIMLARPFTTNGNATLRIAAGENLSSHQYIEALMLTVPVSDSFAIGIVGAHKGSQWLEGGANVSFGITNNWPVLGQVRSFAGDGIVFDFETRAPANYAFAGFEKTWRVSSRFDAGIGVVTANTSDQSGIDVLAGVNLTYWWKNRPN